MPPPDCSLMAECGVYLVVEHNGDVYCCDFFVTPEHRLGNITSSRLDEMLHSGMQTGFGKRKKGLPGGCAGCEHLVHCRGGCPKDWIQGMAGGSMNHLCGAYKMFFAHAGAEIERLVNERRLQMAASETVNQRSSRRPGRNQSCRCGSGLKYKKCCGKI